MKKFILASSSPRRKEILKNAGYDFIIVPSNYDEKISNLKYSKELIENCAYNKAKDIFQNYNNNLIVSCDTVVVLNDIILGKPKDYNDAFNILKKLSNKTHFVASSICLINKNKIIKDTKITYVTFRNLSDIEIKNYLDSKKPFDKAGSYGIQDNGFDFAINIDGELNNIIGFPLELFEKLIKLI